MRTNVRFDKRWREAGYTLNVSASRSENLDTDRFDEVRPEVSLRSNRKSLFGQESGSRSSGPWYSRIYYDANGRLRNTRRGSPTDTTSATSADLAFGLSSQQRPVSWLSVNASLNERWRDADLRSSRDRFEGVRTDRASLSATLSQTIYGLFYPTVFPRVTALRHVLKPDVGLRYEATRADTGGTLGVGGRSRDWKQSRRLTLRLTNSFWVKLLRDEEEVDKVRLAQVNFSTSYDFDRDTRPLSDLVSSVTIDAGRRFSTRINVRSEFYDDDDELQLPRLRQFEVNSTWRIVEQSRGDRSERDRDQYGAGDGDEGSSRYGSSTAYARDEYGFEGGLQRDIRDRAPRQLQLSHYFSRRRSSFGNQTRSWLRTAAGWSWRRSWHFHYSVNYNLHRPGAAILARDRVTSELLSLRRAFHDWSATVNIEPTRFAEDHAFYFKAQFKDIPQIRFERGERGGI